MTEQYTRAALATMTPDEIVAAHKAGQLEDILSGKTGTVTAHPRPEQLARADLAGMTPEEIEAARQAGRLADLLSGYDLTPPPALSTSDDPAVDATVERRIAANETAAALLPPALSAASLRGLPRERILELWRSGSLNHIAAPPTDR